MTKAKTVGQKRRGRPKAEGITREPNGRASRSDSGARQQAEAMKPALEARAKELGISIPVPKQLAGETLEEFTVRRNARDAAMRAATPILRRPWAGCAVGRAIADEENVADLWEAVELIRARREAYLRAIDAKPERAKGAALMVAPSAEETSPEVRLADIRTEDERIAAAEEQWEKLRDVLFALHPMAVRFSIDRICAELGGANEGAVPKEPLIRILQHVRAKLISPSE